MTLSVFTFTIKLRENRKKRERKVFLSKHMLDISLHRRVETKTETAKGYFAQQQQQKCEWFAIKLICLCEWNELKMEYIIKYLHFQMHKFNNILFTFNCKRWMMNWLPSYSLFRIHFSCLLIIIKSNQIFW